MNFPNQSPSFSGRRSYHWKPQTQDQQQFVHFRPTPSTTTLPYSLTSSCDFNDTSLTAKFKRTDKTFDIQPKGALPKLEYLRIIKSAPSLKQQNHFIKKQPYSHILPLQIEPLTSDQQENTSIVQQFNKLEIHEKGYTRQKHSNNTLQRSLKYVESSPLLLPSQKCDPLGFTFSLQSTQPEQKQIQEQNLLQNQQTQYNPPLQKRSLQQSITQKQMRYRQLIRYATREYSPRHKQSLKFEMKTLINQIYQLKKQQH